MPQPHLPRPEPEIPPARPVLADDPPRFLLLMRPGSTPSRSSKGRHSYRQGGQRGALARWLALLATVAPYPLAARLAWLLLGVTISPMGIWRVAQRLGEAAARHTDALSRYHADSRSIGAPTQAAPSAVVLGVDGCSLGMQVRSKRRRRKAGETLPPLPPIEEGRFREVKPGIAHISRSSCSLPPSWNALE
jgi:hypothetical protein